MLPARLAVLGVGLIGGSLALKWQRAGAVSAVCGWDASAQALDMALQRQVIQEAAASPQAAIAGANIVLLALPVSAACALAAKLAPYLQPGQIVTDVSSVKGPVVSAWDQACPDGVAFVGGHPMAGSEKAGVEHARPGLFAGANYFLTPSRRSSPSALATMTELALAAGATPICLSPTEHDALVAFTSHLPHLCAATLVNTAAAATSDYAAYAAGGFADTTRIALSNPTLWRDIFVANRSAVLAALDEFQHQLNQARKLLVEEHTDNFESFLAHAQKSRSSLAYLKDGQILPVQSPREQEG